MDPSLSQGRLDPGLGCPRQARPALKLPKEKLETASLSPEPRPPQAKKRKTKLKKKQDQDQFEMNNFCSDTESNPANNDKDFSNDHYEFKDFTPSPLDSANLKRRRITEDSHDWSLSQSSYTHFSTQSLGEDKKEKNSTENAKISRNFSKFPVRDHIIPASEEILPPTQNTINTEFLSNPWSPENSKNPQKSKNVQKCLKNEKLEKSEKSQNPRSSPYVLSEEDPDPNLNLAPTPPRPGREAAGGSVPLSVARSLWCALKGKLLSPEVVSGRGGNNGLPFECCNGHRFIISLSALGRLAADEQKEFENYWCLKCRNFLHKTVERAKETNSQVLNSCLSKGYVEVKCFNQHMFRIGYTKNHSKTWCERWKSEEILKKQQKYREKEISEEERKKRQQQQIFLESQRYMAEQESQRNSAFASQQEAVYFEALVKQVWLQAKKKMEREMSSNDFKGESTSSEVYNVYKLLYMPERVLIKTLVMIGKGQLNTYYRQLALLLHPDKNKHQYAKDAFTKLNSAYELCKQIV